MARPGVHWYSCELTEIFVNIQALGKAEIGPERLRTCDHLELIRHVRFSGVQVAAGQEEDHRQVRQVGEADFGRRVEKQIRSSAVKDEAVVLVLLDGEKAVDAGGPIS